MSDTYLNLSHQFAIGFAVHISSEYRPQIFNSTNQVPVTLVLTFAVILTYWLIKRVKEITHPKAVVLKDALGLFFLILSTVLVLLFIGTFDSFFGRSLASDPSLVNLYRPLLLIMVVIAGMVVTRLVTGQYDEQFSAASAKQP